MAQWPPRLTLELDQTVRTSQRLSNSLNSMDIQARSMPTR